MSTGEFPSSVPGQEPERPIYKRDGKFSSFRKIKKKSPTNAPPVRAGGFVSLATTSTTTTSKPNSTTHFNNSPPSGSELTERVGVKPISRPRGRSFHSPHSLTSLSRSYPSQSQEGFSPIVVPPNALSLLRGALDEEHAAILAFTLRESDFEAELKEKRARVEVLLRQSERRKEWIKLDTAAVEEVGKMLTTVGLAVRDQETLLQSEGYQALVFPNNDLYEGSWKNSRMHGKGFFKRDALGDVYEGQWFGGQRYGNGSLYSTRFQTFFSGSWLDNRRHGKGELIEPEGCFMGDFVDHHIEGYGEYNYHDGHAYKGEWVNDRYEGNGTYYYPSGSRYEGQWRRGREHGKGIMTFYNGDAYSGEWVAGRPHGYGSYTGALCQVEGNWNYGTLEGEVNCLFADGSRYKGTAGKDTFQKEGELSSTTGVVYQGGFLDGKRHGYGFYSSPEVQYEGSWARDRKEGDGRIDILGTGTVEGRWKEDKIIQMYDKEETASRRKNQHRRLIDVSLRGKDDPHARVKKETGAGPYVEGDYSSSGSSSASDNEGSTDLQRKFSNFHDIEDNVNFFQLLSPNGELRVGFAENEESTVSYQPLKRNASRTMPHLGSRGTSMRSYASTKKGEEPEEEEEEEENHKQDIRERKGTITSVSELQSTSRSAPFNSREL